ncbi:hypothetical protein SEA_ARCHIMEDES_52 [Gordonia phage Archimedes]|uniref:Uncharacterized protein n=1 Tax=Gordonia phage Archimedes TaxID=2759389 RepID=A0A7L7SH39_9CAUD|nr:hypothetical protein KCH38_gp52 [Gordonia phage Archimedes]QOC55752.1 hypothetical protein SEA_ARCHIMEDES_52 [Gordonia phage Archimedes]
MNKFYDQWDESPIKEPESMNVTDPNERQSLWNQVAIELDPCVAVREKLSELARVLKTLGNTSPGDLYRGGRESHIDKLDMAAFQILGVWHRDQPLALSSAVREFLVEELAKYVEEVEDRMAIDRLVARLR